MSKLPDEYPFILVMVFIFVLALVALLVGAK